jgi:hypothetical protein
VTVAQPIPRERAIDLTRRALAGKVDLPPAAPVTVELRGDRYVVTFPIPPRPGVRGADYHARVTLDAATGAVLEILGAP